MNNAVQDTDSARLVLYAFVRSFFDSQPSREKHEYWLMLLDALGSGTGSRPLDEALLALKTALSNSEVIDVQNEYYELFENPFSPNRVQLFSSWYKDGKIMGPSLVKLRQLLYNLNLGKEDGFRATEDHLVFLIDVMMHLIEESGRQDYENTGVQASILRNYLLPVIRGMEEKIGSLENFTVYKAAISVASAFLGLEECLFPSGDST